MWGPLVCALLRRRRTTTNFDYAVPSGFIMLCLPCPRGGFVIWARGGIHLPVVADRLADLPRSYTTRLRGSMAYAGTAPTVVHTWKPDARDPGLDTSSAGEYNPRPTVEGTGLSPDYPFKRYRQNIILLVQPIATYHAGAVRGLINWLYYTDQGREKLRWAESKPNTAMRFHKGFFPQPKNWQGAG